MTMKRGFTFILATLLSALSVEVASAQIATQTVNGLSPNSNGQLTMPNAPLQVSAATVSIGGGLLIAGGCSAGTATVSGATTSMVAVASPVTYPGDGVQWQAYVSSPNTVTVKVCGIIAITPASTTYNVRVVQ